MESLMSSSVIPSPVSFELTTDTNIVFHMPTTKGEDYYIPTFTIEKPDDVFQTRIIYLNDNEIVELERKRYENEKNKYLKDYEGKYIALLNGKLLGSDNKLSNLAKKVYDNIGYKAVFMTLVTRREKPYRMSSPKLKQKELV